MASRPTPTAAIAGTELVLVARVVLPSLTRRVLSGGAARSLTTSTGGEAGSASPSA